MNLKEYKNQKPVQKLQPWSVKITRNEIVQSGNFTSFKGVNLEIVKIWNFNYILINNSGGLWTINEKGHPEKETVFYLIN